MDFADATPGSMLLLRDRVKSLTGQVETLKRELHEYQRGMSAQKVTSAKLERELARVQARLFSGGEDREICDLRAENRKLALHLNREQLSREKLEQRLMQETVRQLPCIRPEAAVPDPPGEAGEQLCPLAPGKKCHHRLCNKLILLVGGPDRRESHYRRLVEQDFGGVFLRHDGDCRNGQARLVNMVKQAEVVICPISCTSHQAYRCAKKWCKRLNKPCLLMHNTGVGALTRTLMELAHPEGSGAGAEVC